MNFHSCFITEYGKKYAGPYAEHMVPAVYLYGLAIEKGSWRSSTGGVFTRFADSPARWLSHM